MLFYYYLYLEPIFLIFILEYQGFPHPKEFLDHTTHEKLISPYYNSVEINPKGL